MEAGQLPVYRGYALNSMGRILRDFALGMNCVCLNHRIFLTRHGLDLTQICSEVLEGLEARGFVSVIEEAITLENEGTLWGDDVGKVPVETVRKGWQPG